MDIKIASTIVLMMTGIAIGVEDLRRTSAGVIFKSLGSIQSSSSVWYHTFAVDLPSIPEEWKHFSKLYPSIESHGCNETTSRKSCSSQRISISNLILSMNTEIADTFEKILKGAKTTIPSHASPYQMRKKRSAPLSFIGSLSQTIFGTATVDDVQRVAGNVNELIRRERLSAKTLVAHEKNFQSFVKLSNNRFTGLKQIVSDNHNLIKQLKEYEINSTDIIYQKINLNSLALVQFNKTNYVVRNLRDIGAAIGELAKGYLSPLLVSDLAIKTVIMKINKKIAEKTRDRDHQILSDHSFRTHNSFFVLLQDNTIMITLKFQVGQTMRKSHLYQLLVRPVPTSKDGNHATKIAGLPDYVIISDDLSGKQYTTMTSAQQSQCQGRHHLICPFGFLYRSSLRKNCLASLIRDSADDINEYCDFRYFHDHLKPSIEAISENKFLIYDIKKISLNVAGVTKIVKGCHFCIMTIPCHARIQIDDLISDRVLSQDCIGDKNKVTHEHVVNLAMVKAFVKENKDLGLKASTVYRTEQNVKVPNFDFYEHHYQDFLTTDQKSNLNLKKIIQASNKQKKIFQSIAEPFIMTTEENGSWFGMSMNIADVILFIYLGFLTVFYIRLNRIYKNKNNSSKTIVKFDDTSKKNTNIQDSTQNLKIKVTEETKPKVEMCDDIELSELESDNNISEIESITTKKRTYHYIN